MITGTDFDNFSIYRHAQNVLPQPDLPIALIWKFSDSDNKILTSVHKEVKKKMKELESLVYDYLLLKFANDSYVSASYFYEQVKVSVLLLLQMLDNSHKDVENTKNKKKSRR